MSPRILEHDEFVVRTASLLHAQGLDAAAIEQRLADTVGPVGIQALRSRLTPPSGTFRAALADELSGVTVPGPELALRALALEHGITDAYRGIWRSLHGYGIYLAGVAAVATTAFVIVHFFTLPSFETLVGDINDGSRVVDAFYRLRLGIVSVLLLWLFAGVTIASTMLTRRAILLRAWPRRLGRFLLLRESIDRHRRLLGAWTALTLVELGIPQGDALSRADAVVRRWCGTGGGAQVADEAERLAWAHALGTLREELRHRVAAELVDAPLALASQRERLALYGGLVAAALIVPMLVAMYRLIFLAVSQS